MKKRLLVYALALTLLASLLCVSALAADGDFTIEGGVLVKYNGTGGDVVIPAGVTAIGEKAFYDCVDLTSVTLPAGVTAIGNYAFFKCTRLTYATIPASVTSIGQGVFLSCESLTDVTLPAGLTALSQSTFQGCRSLTNITIPAGVTAIGQSAFQGCASLTSITIPAGVTSIGSHTFARCTGLTSITVPAGVTSIGYMAFSNNANLTGVAIPPSVPTLEDYLFHESPKVTLYGAAGSAAETYATEHEMPFVVGQAVPVPLAYARAQAIQLDGTEVAFHAYALKDQRGNETNYVKLRDLAHVLNGTAVQFNVGFDGAVNIQTRAAYLPNGSEMTTPFSGDRPYTVNISPINVNGTGAPLDAIVLNDDSGAGYTYFKLRDIARLMAFEVKWDASAGKIVMETAQPYTGDVIVKDGVVTGYTGPGGNVAIPAGVTAIGEEAFYKCTSMTGITLPASLTTIDNWAFGGCTGLTSVTLPANLTTMGYSVFNGCTSLTSVTAPASLTKIGTHAFGETPWLKSLGEFAVVNGTLLAYQGPGGQVTIPAEVTTIGSWAFAGCTSVTGVTFPDSVTSIQDAAFYDCTGLTSVTIPAGIQEVDLNAFWQCTNLTSVTIPAGVTPIAIHNSYSMGPFVPIPEGSVSMDRDAFTDCPNLSIHGAAGSAAEGYAKDIGIPFVAE